MGIVVDTYINLSYLFKDSTYLWNVVLELKLIHDEDPGKLSWYFCDTFIRCACIYHVVKPSRTIYGRTSFVGRFVYHVVFPHVGRFVYHVVFPHVCRFVYRVVFPHVQVRTFPIPLLYHINCCYQRLFCWK